jgi:hypothetical protein
MATPTTIKAALIAVCLMAVIMTALLVIEIP